MKSELPNVYTVFVSNQMKFASREIEFISRVLQLRPDYYWQEHILC
jgi:hypothetical protein